MGDIGSSACPICMGTKRVMVGMSFPPKKTMAVKYEYDPCPNCQPGPHSFHARRAMQILVEMRERRAALRGKGGEG